MSQVDTLQVTQPSPHAYSTLFGDEVVVCFFVVVVDFFSPQKKSEGRRKRKESIFAPKTTKPEKNNQQEMTNDPASGETTIEEGEMVDRVTSGQQEEGEGEAEAAKETEEAEEIEQNEIAFKVLQDMMLTNNEIGIVRWCRTMDLLAVSFRNTHQVHVIRPSNLQRLHIVHPSQLLLRSCSHVTSTLTVGGEVNQRKKSGGTKVSNIDDLCWSADGLLLAIASSSSSSSSPSPSSGTSDNVDYCGIDLLDLESGQIVYSIRPSDSTIASIPSSQSTHKRQYCKLYWLNHEQLIENVQAQLNERTHHSENSVRPLFGLPDFNSLLTNQNIKVPIDTRHHALLKPVQSFHVLVALTDTRCLDFYAMGTMYMFSIYLTAIGMTQDTDTVTNVTVAKDFSHVVLSVEDDLCLSRVVTVSLMDVLCPQRALSIAADYSHFIHAHDILFDDILLRSPDGANSSKIGRCIHIMHTIWEQLFTKQFLPLFTDLHTNIVRENLLVQNNQPSENINSALVTLLAAGTVDHPTLQWLTINANDQNLTKLVRALRQVHRALTTYTIDYLQNYIESVIVRLSNMFHTHCEPVRIAQNLYKLCQQTMDQSNLVFRELDDLLEFIRHAQLRICGKSKVTQRLQQMGQFVPLPLRTYDVKLVSRCLRSAWTTDRLTHHFQRVHSEYCHLRQALSTMMQDRGNALSIQLSAAIAPTVRQPTVFQGQVLSVQASNNNNDHTCTCTLVQLMESGEQAGEQFLHLSRIEPRDSTVETATVCIPEGFSIEYCNFYGEDTYQLFCLLRSHDPDTAGQIAMVTCSYAQVSWTNASSVFTEAEAMHIVKHRTLERKGELCGVDIVGGKVSLGCIVTSLEERRGFHWSIFDMEENE